MVDGLYFRQLLSGRDFAAEDQLAVQMVNFTYLIGDRGTGEAVVVDPAYRVEEIVDAVAADGMRLVGVLATHHHPDHVGGSMAGFDIEGVARLKELVDVPIHANRHESEWIRRVTGVAATDLVSHDGGEVMTVGAVPIRTIHTPGHTPGSQCFLVDEAMLVAGDTLFLEGCGRTDLPGSDPRAMQESLRLLASLPDEVAVFPGHRYSAPSSATLGFVKEMNPFLQAS